MTAEREITDAPSAVVDPVTVRTHRWGFGAFLLVFAVFVLTAVMIGAVFRAMAPQVTASPTAIVIGTMVPTVVAACVTLLITKIRGNGPRIDLRWSMRREDVRAGIKWGVIGLICTTFAAFVWTSVVGEQNAQSAIGALVDNQRMPIVPAIILFVFVWLIGPVCEELIYRGLLWGALERLKWGRWAVFGLTTVIFAVSHLEPLRTTLLLVIGIPIGLARLFSGRLGASIVAHQVNNFLPALATLLVAVGAMPA
ncbi:CPBP family intramembrane glutamic endopeptidase [Actinophytocola sp.]|uniref:CPBP family intramembrane glutamic endopeptidase n=1 Tax=Actinophytocola sp. TaxID=1872138 RepID=UPI002D4F0D24|nr:CPBP family intramembrane glutamic endopeptidase [Actinophytocola sp.]HYQ64715.1 CPBP family intramembrane glutamic endopeptidase [Actinophytocola sp.]